MHGFDTKLSPKQKKEADEWVQHSHYFSRRKIDKIMNKFNMKPSHQQRKHRSDG
jgi:hypothetical protein